MLHKFEEFEFIYKGDEFVINSIVECHIEDNGVGLNEFGGYRSNNILEDLSDPIIIDFEVKKYLDEDDSYTYDIPEELIDEVQFSFIDSISDIMIENIKYYEEEYVI